VSDKCKEQKHKENKLESNILETQILTDADTYPDNSVIEKALGADRFGLFLKFIEKIEALNLTIEWRYYNDGKAWLGKIWYKKKNLGWLSIWNVGFKVTVFFTEKTIEGFNALGIDIKAQIPTGKLIPIIMTIKDDKILDNLISILKYKKELK
jgi:hypothetical protein